MVRRLAGVCVLLTATMLSGCARSTNAWQGRGGPPRVVVTIPALDSFVRNVGGDHVGVICLCTTRGPHHYEYTPQDAVVLRDADLFLAIGLTLDDTFADPMQTESHNPRLRYVKLGERLPGKLLLKGEEEHDHGKEEVKHDHQHGEHDPHIWLGIEQAKEMVKIIRDELKAVDAAHADDYDKNADGYLQALDRLTEYGKDKLKGKKDRKLIAFHESLVYFAKSFDLNIVDAIEVAPGQEPSPGHMKELVEKCKKENVRVIAVEPQYPKGTSAEVLQREVPGVEFAVVDPLENAGDKDVKEDQKELKDKGWYERKMKQNLDALAKGLP